MSNKVALPFWSPNPYRKFCWPWWKDFGSFLTTGWLYDIRRFIHRGRYGWAPGDVWSLDHYLCVVLAGALESLAERGHGTPATYPYEKAHVIDALTGRPRPYTERDNTNDIICDHNKWTDDLYRWSSMFSAACSDDFYEKHGHDYKAWHEDEKKRSADLHRALIEIEPWFESLWI